MFASRLQQRLLSSPVHRPQRPFSSFRRLLQDSKPARPNPPSPPRRRSNSDQLPILPLVIIFFTGSFLFYRLAKSREGQGSGRGPKPPAIADVDAANLEQRKYREA